MSQEVEVGYKNSKVENNLMITIHMPTQVLMSNRTDVECPECGTREVFFMTCPPACAKCGINFPDMAEIRDDPEERVKWHFSANGDNII